MAVVREKCGVHAKLLYSLQILELWEYALANGEAICYSFRARHWVNYRCYFY